jgi:hypothetical protein
MNITSMVETAEVTVSQFVRDMSMAESVLVEALTHCDAGHRVDADTANMSAKAADMRASEAADMSTTKATNEQR